MMNMHSKYDNMYQDQMNYPVKSTNNHVILGMNCMLSIISIKAHVPPSFMKKCIRDIQSVK